MQPKGSDGNTDDASMEEEEEEGEEVQIVEEAMQLVPQRMRKPADNLHILLAQKKTGKGNWWAFLQPMMEKKPSDKQPQCYLKCVRQGSECGKLLACSKPSRK